MSETARERYERESSEQYQTNKSDILSVVIEKLTELVENSEKEQKEKFGNSDSEESSGRSTPKGVATHRGSRSPARSSRRSKLYKCPNCPCLFAVTKKELQRKNPPLCLCCEKVRNAKIPEPSEVTTQEQSSVLCEVCPYKASDYPSLLQHLAKHPKSDVYKCVLCDYVTTRQPSIIEHQNTHIRPTNAAARKYKCNECDYFTPDLGNLQTHLQKHNKHGELLLKCSDCGYSCKCEDTLRKHMLKHVSSSGDDNQDKASEETSTSRNATSATEDKPNLYKCLLCGYICEKLCTLKAHAWRHAGERECSYPVVDEDENLKRSISQGNKHLEAETVSEIAIGCCGDSNQGCCSTGRGDADEEAQCKCPSIAIPSTSLTALQKLAVNTGYKRGNKSPRHISGNVKVQGNSILTPEVLSKLIRGGASANDSSVSQSSKLQAIGKQIPETTPKDTSVVFVPPSNSNQSGVVLGKKHQEVPIDIPLDVQMVEDEVEIATTEASPEKDLPKNISPRGSSSPDIKQGKEKEPTTLSSDAMEVLSSIDGGCCSTVPSSSNTVDARKRKLDCSDPDVDSDEPSSSHKQLRLDKTVTLPSRIGTFSRSVVMLGASKSSSNDSKTLPRTSTSPSTNSNSMPTSLPSTISKLAKSLSKPPQAERLLLQEPTSVRIISKKGSHPPQSHISSIQGHSGPNVISIQCRTSSSKESSPDMVQIDQIESDLRQHGISESLLTVIEKFREETENGGKNSCYYCPVCGHKADTSLRLKEHIQQCHCKGPIKCPKCPAVFYTQSKLDTHSAQHDDGTENQDNSKQKEGASSSGKKKSQQSNGSNVCENCNRTFIGINAMSTHKRSCAAVDCATSPKGYEEQNESGGDEKENDAVMLRSNWECPKCTATFDSKTQWVDHLEGHSEKSKEDQPGPNNVTCQTCSREFVGTFALSIHRRSCTKKKPWHPCSECDFSAPTSTELSNHVAIHRKPYKCDLCAYTSASISGIRNHMKFHSTEKPYKCHMCDFRGAYPQSLRSHMKAHQTIFPTQTSSDTVEQFKCKLCGYICNHLPSLKSHMWRHASDPNYNYDIINDAINSVMDSLIANSPNSATIKTEQIATTTGEEKDTGTSTVTETETGKESTSSAPSSESTISAKTSVAKEVYSNTPRLIMIKTGGSSRPKMVLMSKHPVPVSSSTSSSSSSSVKEVSGRMEKMKGLDDAGIEYGVMVLMCSECSFQTVSKDEMFVHVTTEHQK